MILEDLHVHTTYCDGQNSPEEMVRAAIFLGMKKIGFSCHLYTDFDESYCIKKESIETYKKEIAELKLKYKDKIKVLCGTEKDFYSKEPTEDFDYVIGSVHYVKKDEKFFPLDICEEEFKELVKTKYNGDFFELCEDYYKNMENLIQKTNADIIGHFDLITKFNEKGKLFDTKNIRYVNAAKKAVKTLIPFGVPFEINTGAISRGYRSEAYPENQILRYILENGGRVILSSDSHSADTLCNDFDKYENLVKEIGFKIG